MALINEKATAAPAPLQPLVRRRVAAANWHWSAIREPDAKFLSQCLPQHLNLLRARPPVRHPHTRQRQLLARKQDNMRLILRVPVAVERLSDHHIANPVDFNGV